MSTTDPGEDIREQAARWVVRMTEPEAALSPAERDEFDAFIVEPRHAQEFQAQLGIATLAADLAETDRARLTRWAETHNEERAQSRRQVYRWSAIAASLFAVLIFGGYLALTQHWFNESAYVTRAGQTRVVTFQENSVAYLNTRTEVRWTGSARDRRVELAEGEALFDVVHDAARPFRVMVDNSEIRVLGTRFNVYRKESGDITVTVLEGTVEVRGFGNGGAQPEWVRRVGANQQIQYRAIGLVREPYQTQAQDAVLWRTGFYQFNNQPIEKVLEELTRYTDQRIYIRDTRIAQTRASGAFTTFDVRRALAMLKEVAPIEVKEDNGTFIIAYDAKREQPKE